MRVRDSGSELVVHDQPGYGRWAGVLNFAVAGGCAVLAWIYYEPGGEWRDVILLLLVPFAAAIGGMGLWRALVRPVVILRVDGIGGIVTLSRGTVLRRTVDSWPAAQVERFTRAQHAGPTGLPVHGLRLDLADGRSLSAAARWQADGASIDALAARANALLGK